MLQLHGRRQPAADVGPGRSLRFERWGGLSIPGERSNRSKRAGHTVLDNVFRYAARRRILGALAATCVSPAHHARPWRALRRSVRSGLNCGPADVCLVSMAGHAFAAP